MDKGYWLTSESVAEWLPKMMLPERCYYLSAAGRPKRALRGRSRNSPGGFGTTSVHSRFQLLRPCRWGLSRIREGQLKVLDAVVVLQGSR